MQPTGSLRGVTSKAGRAKTSAKRDRSPQHGNCAARRWRRRSLQIVSAGSVGTRYETLATTVLTAPTRASADRGSVIQFQINANPIIGAGPRLENWSFNL